MSRLVDLWDTVFFTLRKKQNQISFLHVLHHVLTASCAWIFCKYAPGINVDSFEIKEYNLKIIYFKNVFHRGARTSYGFSQFICPYFHVLILFLISIRTTYATISVVEIVYYTIAIGSICSDAGLHSLDNYFGMQIKFLLKFHVWWFGNVIFVFIWTVLCSILY